MGTELIITGMQVNMAIDTIEYTYGKKLNMRVYPTCRDALEAISATDAWIIITLSSHTKKKRVIFYD